MLLQIMNLIYPVAPTVSVHPSKLQRCFLFNSQKQSIYQSVLRGWCQTYQVAIRSLQGPHSSFSPTMKLCLKWGTLEHWTARKATLYTTGKIVLNNFFTCTFVSSFRHVTLFCVLLADLIFPVGEVYMCIEEKVTLNNLVYRQEALQKMVMGYESALCDSLLPGFPWNGQCKGSYG